LPCTPTPRPSAYHIPSFDSVILARSK